MENNNVKRGQGRPRVFTTEEIKNHKTTYMLKKEWHCNICNTGRNYTLAGKHCHLKSHKHKSNVEIKFLKEKIDKIKQLNDIVQKIHWLDHLN